MSRCLADNCTVALSSENSSGYCRNHRQMHTPRTALAWTRPQPVWPCATDTVRGCTTTVYADTVEQALDLLGRIADA